MRHLGSCKKVSRMPELPEVETVRRGLEPVLLGAEIVSADIRRPDLRWPFPEKMGERLEGKTVERLWRRSKYILCSLSSGEVLLVHLGMSGRVLIETNAPLVAGNFYNDISPIEKHDHVVLDLASGVRIKYNDARRFGSMDLISYDNLASHPLLAKLGMEPLGNEFNSGFLKEALMGKKTSAKSALLDQRIVAGLGNIYVCEALWRSGISPLREAQKIPSAKLELLVRCIKDVLSEAIDAGGSSLKDHRQANGELGYFQHNFSVYGREDEPCRTEDCAGVITRIVQSGRSSFYCKKCQR